MGGLENGVVNLINRSNPERFEHEVCCLKATGAAMNRLVRRPPLFEMDKREGNDWRMMLRLIRLMRARRPDIVHTRNWGGVDAIVAAKLAGVRCVVHGEHGWNLDDPRGRNLRRRQIRRLLSPAVRRFVAVSADIGDWLVEDVGIDRGKVTVILNGVDTDKFHPGRQLELRRKEGISDSDFVIGCVGRLDPVKNHELLLKAFSKLRIDPTPHLVLVGDGPEKERLLSLRESLSCRDRIHLLGQRDDVAEALRMMDAFVLPSRSEGICNALLEAMATGLPLAATAVGGNVELVRDGDTGMLVPSDDEDAMSSALSRLAEPGAQERFGLNARRRAEEEFSVLSMVESYESLYSSMLSNRFGQAALVGRMPA